MSNDAQSETETVEVKLVLDAIQSLAVAQTENAIRANQTRAERFERYAMKRAQRFQRENQIANQKLGAALAKSLGLEKIPQGWSAWTRPDGVGEVVYREERPKTAPEKKPAESTGGSPETTETPPASGEGKIVPMPVGAANGSGH